MQRCSGCCFLIKLHRAWLQLLSTQGTHQGRWLSETSGAQTLTVAGGQGHTHQGGFQGWEHLPRTSLVFISEGGLQLQQARTIRHGLGIIHVCALRSQGDKEQKLSGETPEREDTSLCPLQRCPCPQYSCLWGVFPYLVIHICSANWDPSYTKKTPFRICTK